LILRYFLERLLVCCGTARYATVRYATVRYSTVRHSTVRFSTVRFSTVQYGTVQYGTVRYGTVRYDTIQYGTIRYGRLKISDKNGLPTVVLFSALRCSQFFFIFRFLNFIEFLLTCILLKFLFWICRLVNPL
jgi:hypothetical protein